MDTPIDQPKTSPALESQANDIREEWEAPTLQELPVSATAAGGGAGADAEGPT